MVEGSYVILGEGKTFQKKNGGDGFQRNLGEVRELNIFFLCFEKGASFFLIRKTNLNRKEVG
jgi:hypothetical protein